MKNQGKVRYRTFQLRRGQAAEEAVRNGLLGEVGDATTFLARSIESLDEKNAQKRDIFDHQSGDLESRLSNLQSAIQRMQATDESGTLTEAEALAKLVNSGQAQLGDILAAEKYGIIQLGAVESRAIQAAFLESRDAAGSLWTGVGDRSRTAYERAEAHERKMKVVMDEMIARGYSATEIQSVMAKEKLAHLALLMGDGMNDMNHDQAMTSTERQKVLGQILGAQDREQGMLRLQLTLGLDNLGSLEGLAQKDLEKIVALMGSQGLDPSLG